MNIIISSISESLEEALRKFGSTLKILHKEVSTPNMTGISNFQVNNLSSIKYMGFVLFGIHQLDFLQLRLINLVA